MLSCSGNCQMFDIDSWALTFARQKVVVQLRVESCATFATIIVATQVTRSHRMRLPQDHGDKIMVTLKARC